MKSFALWAAVAALFGFITPAAHAQTTYTWTGVAAGGGNWSSPQSWSGNLVPVSSLTNSDILFSGTSGLINTVDLLFGTGGGTFDIHSQTFDGSAGTFNITPTNTAVTNLRIGDGGIVVNSTTTQTISNPIVVGADHTWNAAAGNLFVDGTVNATGRTLTFDGPSNITASQSATITGGTFVKNGSGVTTLSANNTPTSVVVNQGTLVVNKVGSGSPIGTGPVTLNGGTLSFRVFGNPVAATGYNHDVVTAISEFPAGTPFGTTRAVDGNNGAGAFVYFQAGVDTAFPNNGLPANGRFTANAVNYQFQDYTGNNVLSLGQGASGTLALVTPGQYRSLNLMNVTGNGPSVYTFTLNFSDGSSTNVTGNSSLDWFNGANPVFTVNGRLNRGTGAVANQNSGNPRIYTTNYNLSATDQQKTLNSITFAPTTATATFTLNIFGFSGTAGSASQVFTNPVLVTADSTLDQQNVTNITLGPLSIGTNVLSFTGAAGTTMTLGATTLSGSPTFDVAAGTAALGALNDAGTAQTITKNGAGALTLAAPATSAVGDTSVVINAGTVNSNNATALGASANVAIASTGQFALGASQTIRSLNDAGAASNSFGALVTLNGNTLTVGDANNAFSTYSGNIRNGSAAGNLVKNGTGTLTLSGANTYSGTTSINAGTLVAPQPGNLGTSAVTIAHGATLAIGSDRVSINTFDNFNFNGNAFGGGTNLSLTVAANDQTSSAFYNQGRVPTYGFHTSFTFNNPVSGADGITFVLHNDPRALSALGVGGGEFGYGDAAGVGPLRITPSLALAMNIYNPGVPAAGVATLTNGTVVQAGFANPANIFLGNGTPIEVTIDYDGTNFVRNYTQGANVSGPISTALDIPGLLGSTAIIGFTGATGGVSANMSIDNFTYDSGTNVNYGNAINLPDNASSNLDVFANSNISTFGIGALTMGSSATLNVTPQAGSTADANYAVKSGGATLNGAATFNISNNGAGTGAVVLGAVNNGVGTGSITKVGAGRLELTASGNYSGGTNVTAGTLRVSNTNGTATGTGAVTIAATGRLDGNGFIVPNTGNAVSIAGTVAPGTSVGTLTFGSGTTAASVTLSGHYEFELQATGPTAGNSTGGSSIPGNHDVLTVIGTLNVANFQADITSLGSTSFNPLQTYSWRIATATAGITGNGTIGAIAGTDFMTGLTNGFVVNTVGTNLYLNYSPVPEPATILAWCAGASALGGWYRRRRTNAKSTI